MLTELKLKWPLRFGTLNKHIFIHLANYSGIICLMSTCCSAALPPADSGYAPSAPSHTNGPAAVLTLKMPSKKEWVCEDGCEKIWATEPP